MFNGLARGSVLLCALALCLVAGCGGEDGPGPSAPVGDSGTPVCIDMDGDGFGTDCPSGEDCDDDDANVTNECRVCVGDPTREGCPCTPQEGVLCEPPPIPHPEGVLICREGTRFCRDYEWTACEPLGDYILVRR